MKKLNKNDRKRKALIKKDNQKSEPNKDPRKKDKKLKIGSIYKTKATNVYKRDKPWKKRMVIPIRRNKKDTDAAVITSIEKDKLSASKQRKMKNKQLLPLEDEYKAISEKSAVSNTKHVIRNKDKSKYENRKTKISYRELKSIKKHIKK